MGKKIRKVWDNGLLSILEQTDDPLTCVGLGIECGSGDDPIKKVDCGHNTEHVFEIYNLGKGLGTFREILGKKQISIDMGIHEHYTDITLLGPPGKTSFGIKALFKGITNQEFDSEIFDIQNEIIEVENLVEYFLDPYKFYITQILAPAIYKGTSFERHLKEPGEVKRITLEDIVAYKQKFYVPNNMVIVGCGPIDSADFYRAISRTFGTLESKELELTQPKFQISPRLKFVSMPQLKSPINSKYDVAYFSYVYPAVPSSHRDSDALQLLEEYLNLSIAGVLDQELREKTGLVYSNAASYETIRSQGYFEVDVSGMKAHKISKAFQALNHIIDKLCTDLVNPDLLEATVSKFCTNNIAEINQLDERAERLIASEIDHQKYDFRTLHKRFREISRRRLRNVAQRYFSQKPLIVVAAPEEYRRRITRQYYNSLLSS